MGVDYSQEIAYLGDQEGADDIIWKCELSTPGHGYYAWLDWSLTYNLIWNPVHQRGYVAGQKISYRYLTTTPKGADGGSGLQVICGVNENGYLKSAKIDNNNLGSGYTDGQLLTIDHPNLSGGGVVAEVKVFARKEKYQIKEAQGYLKTLGYDVIWTPDINWSPDGIFSEHIYRAIRAFQFDIIDANSDNKKVRDHSQEIIDFYSEKTEYKITPNGILTQGTLAALSRCAKNYPNSAPTTQKFKYCSYNWEPSISLHYDHCIRLKGWTQNQAERENDKPFMEKSAAYDYAMLKNMVEDIEKGSSIGTSVYRMHERQLYFEAIDGWLSVTLAYSPGRTDHGYGCAIDFDRDHLQLIAENSDGTRKYYTGHVSTNTGYRDNVDRFRELALANHFISTYCYKGKNNYAREAWHFDHLPAHLPLEIDMSGSTENAVSKKSDTGSLIKYTKSKVLNGDLLQPNEETGCVESLEMDQRVDLMEKSQFFRYKMEKGPVQNIHFQSVNSAYEFTNNTTLQPIGGTGQDLEITIATSDDVVSEYSIEAGGSNYEAGDSLTQSSTSGGSGTGFTCDVGGLEVSNAEVNSIIITNGGSGYVVDEEISMTGSGTGTGLVIKVKATIDGVINSIAFVNHGDNYSEGDEISIVEVDGQGNIERSVNAICRLASDWEFDVYRIHRDLAERFNNLVNPCTCNSAITALQLPVLQDAFHESASGSRANWPDVYVVYRLELPAGSNNNSEGFTTGNVDISGGNNDLRINIDSVDSAGKITQISVVNPGTGFNHGETVTISQTGNTNAINGEATCAYPSIQYDGTAWSSDNFVFGLVLLYLARDNNQWTWEDLGVSS